MSKVELDTRQTWGSGQQSDSTQWLAFYHPAGTSPVQTLQVCKPCESESRIYAVSSSCSAIFDGILYNREELISEFSNRCLNDLNDAELVLRAYQNFGKKIVNRIKGIFAVIIADHAQETLLCFRDPIGVYPLFYVHIGEEWYFSTSITALTYHPPISPDVDRVVIAEYLCHRWLNTEETLYRSVKRVPPGYMLESNKGHQKVYRYMDLPTSSEEVGYLEEDHLYLFDELLDQAVSRCLSHGNAGIFLSGGLDSVSVAAVANEQIRQSGRPDLQALSLIFPQDCNEEVVQRGVASTLDLPHLLLTLEEATEPQGLLQSCLDMAGQSAMPLQNPWKPAYYRLAMEGKQRGCKVILTGGGGDEWLGVTPLLAADLIRSFDIGGLLHLWKSLQRSYPIPWYWMANNMLWRFGTKPILKDIKDETLYRLFPNSAPQFLTTRLFHHILSLAPAWINPDLSLRQVMDQRLEQSLTQKQQMHRRISSFYLRELWGPFEHPLTTLEMEELYEENCQIGVKVLMPYWDADLLTLLYRTPPHLLLKGGRSKGLVRDSLARRFPQLGFERQKKVVSLNLYQSILLEQGKIAWQKLGHTLALADLGIVNGQQLRTEMEEIFDGKHLRWVHRIWDVLSMEAWLRSR